MSNDRVWRSSNDAAAYLGVTPPTLYRLANAGTVVSYRIGRVYRYRTADLDDYLARAKVQPGDLDHLVPQSVSRSDGPAGAGAHRNARSD
jgi:excisionase family DNA binding protein